MSNKVQTLNNCPGQTKISAAKRTKQRLNVRCWLLCAEEERSARLQPLALVATTRQDEARHHAVTCIAGVHRQRDAVAGAVWFRRVLTTTSIISTQLKRRFRIEFALLTV